MCMDMHTRHKAVAVGSLKVCYIVFDQIIVSMSQPLASPIQSAGIFDFSRTIPSRHMKSEYAQRCEYAQYVRKEKSSSLCHAEHAAMWAGALARTDT